MPEKQLPARPNLEQYKKQAKDLAKQCGLGIPDALARVQRHHPRFHKLTETEIRASQIHPHRCPTCPRPRTRLRELAKVCPAHRNSSADSFRCLARRSRSSLYRSWPVCPRHSDHSSGTLEHAELILARYPQVATANVFTAVILADEAAVRGFLARDPKGRDDDWRPAWLGRIDSSLFLTLFAPGAQHARRPSCAQPGLSWMLEPAPRPAGTK